MAKEQLCLEKVEQYDSSIQENEVLVHSARFSQHATLPLFFFCIQSRLEDFHCKKEMTQQAKHCQVAPFC